MSEDEISSSRAVATQEKLGSYTEDDLLPLSRLADLEYCERRAGLHLIEQVWEDNVHTAQGTVQHGKVHEVEGTQLRGDVRIARGLWVRSFRLGLIGKCDVVEFRNGRDPYPIEYKPGRMRYQESFRIQLCAQAICLEDMLGVEVPRGALFYGKAQRRMDVEFDDALRAKTEVASRRLHEIVASGRTPAAQYEKKRCEQCSLVDLCMPQTIGKRRSARRYVDGIE